MQWVSRGPADLYALRGPSASGSPCPFRSAGAHTLDSLSPPNRRSKETTEDVSEREGRARICPGEGGTDRRTRDGRTRTPWGGRDGPDVERRPPTELQPRAPELLHICFYRLCLE
ncbi:hypothetical protein AAFF_G00005630 [Aldrovandia affinis]|uniref:Uncharacterized protein n=1 Tax=Aldrovandia affinis TaxID=143900 RepID=A0AAD7TDP1_9TELE|nr:hypothetical protein AAFF_G00005630 [Aldrovandia affinis]